MLSSRCVASLCCTHIIQSEQTTRNAQNKLAATVAETRNAVTNLTELPLPETLADSNLECNIQISTHRRKDFMTNQELKLLRVCLANVHRPRWRGAPPENLGSAKNGKLKADVLRTLAEFDLGVAVVQMGANSPDTKTDMTISLFTAIRFATSSQMTSGIARKYMEHLTNYLHALKDGGWHLVPNHHAALHIGDMLCRLGPMHAWWMFPYERIIGQLQRMNTNHRLGKRLFKYSG
jgi:hypothetical protein